MKKLFMLSILLFSIFGLSLNVTHAGKDALMDFIKENDRITKDTWLDYSSDQKIVTYLNKLGMTMFTDLKDFRPYDNIKRSEVTKFFVNFANKKGFNSGSSNNKCNFKDIWGLKGSDLHGYITQSCQMGLFNGAHWKFNPWGLLTYGEAITVMIRMIEGTKLPETWNHFAYNYYMKAKEFMLIPNHLKWLSATNVASLNTPISRIEMGRLLEGADFYKLQVQKKAMETLNSI